jgi:integrase
MSRSATSISRARLGTFRTRRTSAITRSTSAPSRWRRKLHELREVEPDNTSKAVAWVFPNTALTGPVGSKSLGEQLSDRQRELARRIQGRSKATSSLVLPGGRWTAHDLRRTAATMMAAMGISGDVIDEWLNHMIESRMRRTYIPTFATAASVNSRRRLKFWGGDAGGLPHAVVLWDSVKRAQTEPVGDRFNCTTSTPRKGERR